METFRPLDFLFSPICENDTAEIAVSKSYFSIINGHYPLSGPRVVLSLMMMMYGSL